jgi:hypothetical protein
VSEKQGTFFVEASRVESRPTLREWKKIIEAWIEESEFPQLQKIETDPVQHRYGERRTDSN